MKILGLSPSFIFILILALILVGIVSSFIRAYAYKMTGVRPIQTGSLINVTV